MDGSMGQTGDEPVDGEVADDVLVARAREGDEAAFAALVRRYERLVFRTVAGLVRRVEDAEEVAQQAFLNAYQGLPRFEAGRPLAPWLVRVAVNAALDRLRADRRRPGARPDLRARDAAALPGPRGGAGGASGRLAEEDLVARDLAERLLGTLGPKDRVAVLLMDVQGYSIGEVAAALGSSEGAARLRLFRARRRLRAAWRRLEGSGEG
jgi:RNA polymerase sigma-70 factor (ECF subfamily)